MLPLNGNTPGLAEKIRNLQTNNARISGATGGGIVNAPTSVVVNLKVDQITKAASSAASAVKNAVASKLSTISGHPTRTTPSPTF